MTDLRKAAEMALELLENHVEDPRCEVSICKTAAALRQALSQPEQEPVACIGTNGELMWLNKPKVIYSKAQPLYTAPQKREWVGLTNADKQEAFDETQEASGGFWEFADYLDAKLREKNGG